MKVQEPIKNLNNGPNRFGISISLTIRPLKYEARSEASGIPLKIDAVIISLLNRSIPSFHARIHYLKGIAF